MWALGCTLFCLAFGRSPFETSREGVLRLAILNGRYVDKGLLAWTHIKYMQTCPYSNPLTKNTTKTTHHLCRWQYPDKYTNTFRVAYSESMYIALIQELLAPDADARPPAAFVVEKIRAALL